MRKNFISIILAFCLFTTVAHASVLGIHTGNGSSLLIDEKTTLYQNTFLSEQSGVGLQNEYYAKYTPNELVRPIVITGESVFGRRTIKEAVEYMQNNNLYPMIGINASFFSYQTGIPMGHVITDGKIISKDSTELDGVGFLKDGSAFFSTLGIKTTAYFQEYEFDIAHINKYCQDTTEVMTLFTDEFGNNTKATAEAINIVLGDIEGELAIGKSLTGVVEEITTTTGGFDIPFGKIVLTINTIGNEWIRTLIDLLLVGEKITITNQATQDEENWNKAYNAMASEGKRLLTNGEINPELEAGAAPRTAVGVTENNDVIFYVIDGRQTGYSYGVKLSTLASRLKELGCVDAVNLDGGGSSSIAGIYPGQNVTSIINSPSDGALRKVTNFIFLQNMQKPTSELRGLYIYPYSGHYLSGSTIKLTSGAVDTANHYMPLPDIEYSMQNNLGTITKEGKLSLSGTGEAKVIVTSGDIIGEASFFVYENPTKIEIYNSETNKKIEKIEADANSTLKLSARAYNNNTLLNAEEELFSWSVDDTVGRIEDDTLFISTRIGEEGKLTVTAGETTHEISVKVNVPDVYPAELYPYSEILIQDNMITVDILSYYEPIDIENCYVKIDGEICSDYEDTKKLQINEKHIVIEIPVNDNFADQHHKILVKSQTVDNYAALEAEYINSASRENNFSDTQNHWAENIISYMNSEKIVNGSDGKFHPDNAMTRAEFAVMMCGFLKVNPTDYKNEKLNFSDLSSIPDWALNYVKAAVSVGIISGKQNGEEILFAPNDNITRAEAAAVIGRTLPENLRKAPLRFVDKKDIPDWSRDYIARLTNAQFMKGYPDNTILPHNKLTRAEAVVMLYNIY